MAMLRSAIRLALRRSSAPACPLFSNVGRGNPGSSIANPASSITTRRNYFSGSGYGFNGYEDLNWKSMDVLFGGITVATSLVFYSKMRPIKENPENRNGGASQRGEKSWTGKKKECV